MALDVDALHTEIREVCGKLDVPWTDFAAYCKGKMIECAINGGIANYSINGRTVTKDLDWWERAMRFAIEMAAVERSGGIDEQPISFLAR